MKPAHKFLLVPLVLGAAITAGIAVEERLNPDPIEKAFRENPGKKVLLLKEPDGEFLCHFKAQEGYGIVPPYFPNFKPSDCNEETFKEKYGVDVRKLRTPQEIYYLRFKEPVPSKKLTHSRQR